MMPPATVRELLAGLIDYAGIFPPAALTLRDAAANYSTYRRSPDAWALARFVAPASSLAELLDAARSHHRAGDTPWRVSALVSDDTARGADAIRTINSAADGVLLVDVVEARASTVAEVEQQMRMLDDSLTVYLELPWSENPRALIATTRRLGARAKIRTGGVTPDAFPAPAQLARFIAYCAEAGVPFKATAGLHHPLRADHRLTDDGGSATTTMFGFLNLFVAAAFAQQGMTEAVLSAVLDERDADALQFRDDDITWRGHALSRAEMRATRERFAIAFGSCSFREPIDDLTRLALL